MITVASVCMTTGACPTQFECETSDGRNLYARYRHGSLEVWVGKKPGHDALDGEFVFDKFLGQDQDDAEVLARYKADGMGDEMYEKMRSSFEVMRSVNPGSPICFSGEMTLAELKTATAGVIEWPEACE